MPRVVPEYKLEARKRIMEVSAKVFSQKGYDGTTMDDIAEALGVSKGALYLYFKSKESLIKAICKAGPGRLKEALRESFTGNDILQDSNAFFEKALSQSKLNLGLNFETLGEASRNPAIRKIVKESYDTALDILVEFLEKIRGEGLVMQKLDTRALAMGLVAIYDGLMASLIMGNDEQSVKDAWNETIRILLSGLKADGKLKP